MPPTITDAGRLHLKWALIDGIAGRRSLEVIHAIYESMETGREVTLRFESRQSRLGSRPAEEKA